MLLGTKIDNRWWAGIQPPQFKHEMGLMDSLRKGVPDQWEQRSPSWTGVHQNNCCPQCNVGGLGTSWSWSWVWSERPAPLSLPEQEGLDPGKGQQGCIREIQESLLSNKHTLWFSGLSGPLVASVGAWWSTELLDINIMSSSQFVCHELKLYLRMSLIQEWTTTLLSRDTLAVGSPLTRLISTQKKGIMKTTSSQSQWNPFLICPSCNFCMRWNCHVIKGCVWKSVLSIDPHQLQALRAELGWKIHPAYHLPSYYRKSSLLVKSFRRW